jgi:hypothetical protein
VPVEGVPEAELERLYSAPPERFVEKRSELARSLSRDGEREAAAAVRKLRKPALPVWAINQLARRRGADLDRLLEAAERLRSGEGPAAGDVSEAVDSLVGAAGELLEEAGHAATDATRQRVAATLRAAAADEQHAAELRAGRIEQELEPAGFASMAALAGPPGGRLRPERREEARAVPKRRLAEARDAVSTARDRARELRRRADEAERAARRARAEADRAEADLQRAERRLESLR